MFTGVAVAVATAAELRAGPTRAIFVGGGAAAGGTEPGRFSAVQMLRVGG
jgi:hypothetical protein